MQKRSILIICSLVAVSLFAYSFISTPEIATAPEVDLEALAQEAYVPTAIEASVDKQFIYDIGPRFAPITKQELAAATSARDFLDAESLARLASFEELSIIIIENDVQTAKRLSNNSIQLSAAQKTMLNQMPYATNFCISAKFLERNALSNNLEHQHWRPHLTLVPAVQAQYSEGLDQLKSYLEKGIYNSTIAVDKDSFKPAKLSFTVTKNGSVSELHLDHTSGYSEIDEALKKLLLAAPGTWKAAKDENGNAVDQNLVISFGMQGC
ncbi:MAG: hypothetical protein ACWA5P_13415 [bacterium]